MMLCSCGNSESFENCCEPLLLGKVLAASAEQLMRSRYSAYVHQKIDYLIETTHTSTRKLYHRKDIEKWAKESKWLKLEILFSSENFVEFKAFHQDKEGKIHEHHEKSNFIFDGGKWFFE
jgi:SEC-C motif-containing protein